VNDNLVTAPANMVDNFTRQP